jgi:hypothetical protein
MCLGSLTGWYATNLAIESEERTFSTWKKLEFIYMHNEWIFENTEGTIQKGLTTSCIMKVDRELNPTMFFSWQCNTRID